MPLDVWLYEYARNIFNARHHYLLTNEKQTPVKPPPPEVLCKSTRFVLACSGGPLGKFVYKWPRLDKIEDEEERLKQEEYFENWKNELE